MEKKTIGIIATVATSVLCACPSLFGLLFGSLFVLAGAIPGSDIDIIGRSDQGIAIGTGLGILCLSIIGIAIPIVVGVLTLRDKPAEESIAFDEPLPPDL